ncbi:MAG: DsrE family protein [Candidatus Hydrothermarchaeaceae archaeon]
MGNEKLLIMLTTGPSDPAVIRSALMFAGIGASMDVETTLYCVQDGVEAMVRSYIEGEKVVPGKPSTRQRLEEAMKMGVDIQVCETACRNKEIKQEDLVDGTRITGAATLIDLALDADATLCF